MYIDSNIFIMAHLNAESKGNAARNVLSQVKEGKRAITSSLTMDEVIWALMKKKVSHIRQVIMHIYSLEHLEVVPVGSLIPIESLEYISEYDLDPRDAFHAAVMKAHRVKEIASTDPDFDRIPGIKRVSI